MRIALVVLCLLFGRLQLTAQVAILSDSAEISLWSVVPGHALYSIFGHSAVQVKDDAYRINKVYNYGTFDFDTPNFYTKFMQGKLLYYLNIESYRQFEYGNMMEQRASTQMVLNLNQEERQRLFYLLETNAEPENKYYKYEFFYDNCATRIRDIIQESVFHTLEWDSSHVAKGTTMRHLLHDHLTEQPWAEFGIDLILGTPCDKKARATEYMFLPKYLGDVVRKTKLKDGKPLVSSERTIGVQTEPTKAGLDLTHPFWVMCLVAIIGLLSMFHPVARKVFDWVFWPTISLVGILILLLWFFTDHTATKTNLNLLWALPTHLFFFLKSKQSEWADNYFVGIGMACLCMLLLYKWLPQQLPFAILPIIALIVAKCFHRKYERV
jgi:hypothetical protein